MTAGPSSHWTLSAATPLEHGALYQSPSVYSFKSSANGTASSHASYYPDARDDPRRYAFLPPQPHTNRHSDLVTSPPILVLKLYRRKHGKGAAKKISNVAQSSTKALGKFLRLPGHSPRDEAVNESSRIPRKLRRPPPRHLGLDGAMEISAPFPSGNRAGFEPRPPPQPPSREAEESDPPSRWYLPTLSRSKSQKHRIMEISSPFPIRDPPPGATLVLDHRSPGLSAKSTRCKALPSPLHRPGGPRTPLSATVSRQVRRTKSERQAARLPGWKYCEYTPLPAEGQPSSLMHAMSTIVRGRDQPFPAQKVADV